MIIPIGLGAHSYDIVLERGAIKKVGELFGIKGRCLWLPIQVYHANMLNVLLRSSAKLYIYLPSG